MMEATLLDNSLRSVAILDLYDSFIWVDRYNEYGDFELYTSMSSEVWSLIENTTYVTIPESDSIMLVETKVIETEHDRPDSLLVSGRSLESLLSRRIIWEQTILSGNLQNGIKKLLTENAIRPKDSKRTIPGLVFKESTDKRITSLKVDAQFTGTNLYTAINRLCVENNIGFTVRLNESLQFVFELYVGEDRSYRQIEHPYVVFSPEYDNLTASTYRRDLKQWANVALIGGEGEGKNRVMVDVGSVSGANRREIFVDARDMSSEPESGPLSPEEYKSQLKQRGLGKLSENNILDEFSGFADTNRMYRYGEDFYMGDVVQIENEYGISGTSRITEMLLSVDSENGRSSVPTFTSTEREEE